MDERSSSALQSKKIIIGLTAVLLLGGAFLYYNSTKPALQDNQLNTDAPGDSMMNQQMNMQQSPSTNTAEQSGTKEIMVGGSNFKFEPSQIKVKLGDKVRVRFMNTQGTHNFTIDDLNVETKTIQSNEEETVEFTATETGEFEYYCSVGNHRDQGMKGTLIVEE